MVEENGGVDRNEMWEKALDTDTCPETNDAQCKPRPADGIGLTILWHRDPARIGDTCLLFEADGGASPLSRLSPLFESGEDAPAKPLSDPRLSRQGISLRKAGDGVEVDTTRSKIHIQVDGEPLRGARHYTADEIGEGLVMLLAKRVAILLHPMTPADDGIPMPSLVGRGNAMIRLRCDIARVAKANDTVLIVGDSGTGKELVASEIREQSRRRNKPFVRINMGAVPPSLATSELFGAAKGAFSGAGQNRQGFFKMADRGTLFMDEIGETPLEVQAALLRTLETGEIQPLGAEKPAKVDVRVIAATDAKLKDAVEQGTFKLPLYYRLAGLVIAIPPLRRRREDLGRLLLHFINAARADQGLPLVCDMGPMYRPWLSAEVVAGLALYDWPGNVRQLANIAKQLVVKSGEAPEAVIDDDILALIRPRRGRRGDEKDKSRVEPRLDPTPTRATYREALEVDEAYLKETLKQHRWNVKSTAEALGISRASLYNLIERYPSIRKASELTREEIETSHTRCDGKLQAMVDDLEVSLDGLKRRIAQLKSS